ncbi:hypothetical protein Shyhy02_31120 [Streptomyces hygroscopicus subsp. hygroscopicus]|nr:hypothetical protein Shyhy02_31120 [Streptomyces hygroscopicus subsp. hygroscopicus]
MTVRTGDELPPLRIPITRTLIVAGALASRDFQDVHHDAEAAREKGSPDIFMNILTTNGLVGRYITDHFGPRARLRKVAIRLGAPNYPGDEMVLTGEITSVADGVAEVAVTGRNGIGHHVTGKVTVQLPDDPRRADGSRYADGPRYADGSRHADGPRYTGGPRHADGPITATGVSRAATGAPGTPTPPTATPNATPGTPNTTPAVPTATPDAPR